MQAPGLRGSSPDAAPTPPPDSGNRSILYYYTKSHPRYAIPVIEPSSRQEEGGTWPTPTDGEDADDTDGEDTEPQTPPASQLSQVW